MKVKHIFIWIPWELHPLILPKATSHFSLNCAVYSTELANKPTDFLLGSALSPQQSPREQCHNKLCWFWAGNVFCLRKAPRFTMKGCQCVREHASSLSVSLSLSLSVQWGSRGGGGRGVRESSAGFLNGWSVGRKCTPGVTHAVVVHSSSCLHHRQIAIETVHYNTRSSVNMLF